MECEWNGMGHNGMKWNGCSLSLSISRRGASSYDTAAREKGSARRRRARRRTPRLGELGALDALPDFLPPHQLDERDRSLRRGGGGRRVPSNESKVPYTPFERKISTESVDYEYMFSRNAPGAQDPWGKFVDWFVSPCTHERAQGHGSKYDTRAARAMCERKLTG